MSTLRKYRLFVITLLSIFVMATSLLWSHLPAEGYLEDRKPSDAFRFGYIGEQRSQISISEWLKNETVSFYAAADRLYEKERNRTFSYFYPIFDNSSSLKEFDKAYPYLPWESIPSMGKSVYSIDYGNARYFFLNGAKIANEDLSQLHWLKQSVEENRQIFNIVFLSHDPGIPELWETMKKIGIQLVILGDQVHASEDYIAQHPAEYTPSVNKGWGLWNASDQFTEPHMLVIEGKDQNLYVKAEDQDKRVLDQLEMSAQSGNQQQAKEAVLIGIQSQWRYHAGGPDIKAVIPEGFDPTGEHPILERFHLPPYDWRSPDYDDSGWNTGRAVLGHTDEMSVGKLIQTELPKDDDSPTYYFRRTFEFSDDPEQVSSLILNLTYEDGCVVYLNGDEILRNSIRTGWLTYQSLAEPNETMLYQRIELKKHRAQLKKGSNLIAVEVHRSHPKSPNMLFDLSLSYQKKGEH